MESVDIESARAVLLGERARLLAEVGEAIVAPEQMTYGSQAAAASQVFEQQRDLALRDRSTAQLALIEAALARIDDGTFGACIRCGRPVAPARLEALPWAATCIDCQRDVDRGAR
jgi:DnaK suppressor protein